MQVRLRGNHLHVLCEGSPCPPEKVTVSQFSTALEQTNLSPLLPPDTATIYKVFLCGRQPGAKRPEWTVRLECNTTQFIEAETSAPQLSTSEIATEQISVWEKLGGILGRRPSRTKDEPSTEPVLLQTTETTEPPTSEPEPVEVALTSTPLSGEHQDQPEPPPILEKPALTTEEIKTPSPTSSPPITTQAKPPEKIPVTLTVPTETLARRGYPDAIASYLSEILGNLGVSVNVSVKELSKKRSSSTTQLPTPSKNCRLWVRCESAYSPDPSLLAEPIAERLRKLQLKNFRDACILLQVQGESKPDWMLRIDLTPTLEILKNWARWGSSKAIARILNQELGTLDAKVRATLKESTLHLFCETLTPDNRRNAPPKAKVMAAIAPILNTLAPQGILAATVYGVDEQNQENLPESPVWIDWLNLPANQHLDLQPHPLTLAQRGNLDALKFLLNQQINPDLETQLATGGVRVLLLRKGKLLHVMTEAPTCPSQSKVAPLLAQFLRSHPLEGVAGVRIYGRRAGQKHPLWRYGVALSQRVQAPEEQVDAFSTEENQDLVASAQGLILRPDLASEELESSESARSPRLRVQWRDALELLSTRLQQGLLATGLITNRVPVLVSVESGGTSGYSKTGMAVVWAAVGCLLALQIDWALGQFLKSNPQLTATAEVNVSQSATTPPTVSGMEAASASVVQPSQNDQGFTRSEFIISTNTTQYQACKTAPDPKACQLSNLLYPSFNSPQLDEQLARYQDYIVQEKRPPDILIVGSSRALRGIDPTVLEKALADVGYPGLKVFNFGVNGATAQVVELIVRHILPPEQLPQLVIVADGVRALNSGRSDRTYEALTASPGYQQIAQGTFRIPTRQLEGASDFQQTLMTLQELSQTPSTTLKQIQQWFDQQFVEISASYPRRDQLKQYLLAVVNNQSLVTPRQELPDLPAPEDNPTQETPKIHRNGFLPLSIQFDPETYYQKYAQVSGYYDSDYQSFELDGVQMNALKKLIEYVQSQQVEIVFVNMPLTQEYLDSVRTAYEEKFLNYMKTVEAETGLTFVNLADQWLNTYDYFSDPSHLNEYGAAAVAEQLAEKSQISWPRRAK